MKKIITIAIILLSGLIKLEAQQLPLFSQYMFNTFLINPSVAGLDGLTAINLTAREQWLGLKDAPRTHVITAQTRLYADNFISRLAHVHRRDNNGSVSGRVGLGVNFYNDINGLIERTGFQFTYAYHLPLDLAELSFGLSFTGYQLSVNKSRMILNDYSDDLYLNSDFSRFIPDFNFGTIYSTKDYYVGMSIQQLLQSSVQFGNSGTSDQYRLYRHFYFHGGYTYPINRDYVLQSSALVKIAKTTVPQLDISSKIVIRDDYWAGLSFRTGSAFVIMGGVTVDKYSFGYAFDYNLSAIRKHSFGSHEIMATVKFGNNASHFKWLNRF
ncbi:MAG TPA: type IX secretion system membrane protein PorP/SprF [Bacteroidales bacterium]